MPGNQPGIASSDQIETGNLRINERVELVADRPSSQEVCLAAKQLPGARTTENETQTLIFNEPVDLVQKGRNLLDLIDDDRLPLGLPIKA